jgi:hypothetical protein
MASTSISNSRFIVWDLSSTCGARGTAPPLEVEHGHEAGLAHFIKLECELAAGALILQGQAPTCLGAAQHATPVLAALKRCFEREVDRLTGEADEVRFFLEQSVDAYTSCRVTASQSSTVTNSPSPWDSG